MRKSYITLLCALFALGANAKDLTWTGCGITKKAFMAEASKAYKKKTGISISLSGGGATKGIRAASAGASDMGGNCRPVLINKFPKKEGNARLTIVAWDAIVPIVNKDNPIDNISSKNLKKLMRGEIKTWGELGLTGANAKKRVMLVLRQGDHSGVGFMGRKILFDFKEGDVGKIDPFTKKAVIVKSSGPLEKKVEAKKWAIGITGISSAKKRNVKILAIDGSAATPQKIAKGEYFTFRPLYITTKGTPSGKVKNFLDWLVSPEGQKMIEGQGTVSLKQGKNLKKKFKHWLYTDRILNFDLIK